jgi:hypothetical protein
MGRKKIKLPSNGLDIIRRLAERGVKETDIARALGMSFKTWKRIKDENEEARETLEEARQIEENKLFGMLYEKAMEGDTVSAIFLLKTRHGYREGAELVNANQVNVKITLPGSMDPDDYRKKLEVQNAD